MSNAPEQEQKRPRSHFIYASALDAKGDFNVARSAVRAAERSRALKQSQERHAEALRTAALIAEIDLALARSAERPRSEQPVAPPKIFEALLEWSLSPKDAEAQLGDLCEAFEKRLRKKSRLNARIWFAWQTIMCVLPAMLKLFTSALSLKAVWDKLSQ